MGDELDKLYEQNKDAISRKMDESRYIGSEYSMPQRRQDETLLFVQKRDAKAAKNKKAQESDEDYDFNEFEDAEVEEAEDMIYSEYKKRQAVGEAVDENVLHALAGDVPL